MVNFFKYFLKKKISIKFYELCITRIIFTNYPFMYPEIRIFLNLISNKLCDIFFCEALTVSDTLRFFRKKNKKLFFDINSREYFFRMMYIKNTHFPNLKSIFKLRPDYLSLKSIVTEKKIKNILFFLNRITFRVSFFSIQFILFLKFFRIVENSVYKNEIRITHFGVYSVLQNLDFQFCKFFNIFLKQTRVLFSKKRKKKSNFFSNYFIFKILKKKHFKKQTNKIGCKNILKLFFEIHNKYKIYAPKLLYQISRECNFFLWFFHELKLLFFPCFFDNLFYLRIFPLKNKHSIYNYNKNFVEKSSKRFQIIVESNYRIYAYNNNNFLNSVLSQFCNLLYILPYLFVGEITKTSIHDATKKGISGKSIIGFIKKNLHNTNKNTHSVVINQIRVWEFQQKKTSIYNCLVIKKEKKTYRIRKSEIQKIC